MGMNGTYSHLVSFALEQPWAVTPAMLRVVATILAERMAGQRRSPDEIAAATAARTPALPRSAVPATLAVLPVHGVLSPRMNLFSEMSGGATYEGLTAQLKALVADSRVHTVVLDVDSPGGSVAGAGEFAETVRWAATKKPVIAQAQHAMCSAAYWVCSGATQIIASPSAMVGSIGVFSIHDDLSAALANLGVRRTYIAAGKHKVDGNETEPLSSAVRERIQAKVDLMYGRFVGDVATGRGVPVQTVRERFGAGDTLFGTEALTLGMVDSIGTLENTIITAAAGPVIAPRLMAERAEAARTALAPFKDELARATLSAHRRTLVMHNVGQNR
jgi:signal peptide peptidase SppA